VIFNAKVVISGSDTNEKHTMVLGTLPLIQFGAGYSPPQKRTASIFTNLTVDIDVRS
jgi:hypothetical protein